MSSWYVISFLKAFLLTTLVEWFAFLPFGRPLGSWKTLGTVIVANAFSLPIVWFAIPAFVTEYSYYALVAEVFAVFSEALILLVLLRLSYKRAIAASAFLNLCSFLVGSIFQRILL